MLLSDSVQRECQITEYDETENEDYCDDKLSVYFCDNQTLDTRLKLVCTTSVNC